ncbi:hypothetical protein HDU99_005118, partial [Rhizoclosmatium hyalinum]
MKKEKQNLWDALEAETEALEDTLLLDPSTPTTAPNAPKSVHFGGSGNGRQLKTLFDDLEKQASLLITTTDHKRKSRAAFSKVHSMAISLKKSMMEEDMWRMLEAETNELNAFFAAPEKKKVVTEEERLGRMEERVFRKLKALEEKNWFIEERVEVADEALRRREAGEKEKEKEPSVKEAKPNMLAALFARKPSDAFASSPSSSAGKGPVKEATSPPSGGVPLAKSSSQKSVKSVKEADEKQLPVVPGGLVMTKNPSEKSVKESPGPLPSGDEQGNASDGSPVQKQGFLKRLWNGGGNKDNKESPQTTTPVPPTTPVPSSTTPLPASTTPLPSPPSVVSPVGPPSAKSNASDPPAAGQQSDRFDSPAPPSPQTPSSPQTPQTPQNQATPQQTPQATTTSGRIMKAMASSSSLKKVTTVVSQAGTAIRRSNTPGPRDPTTLASPTSPSTAPPTPTPAPAQVTSSEQSPQVQQSPGP